MAFRGTVNGARYGTICVFVLTSVIGAKGAPSEISSALGVVEGSHFEAPIAVGVKTFVELITRGNVFVDKSPLIKEIFQVDRTVSESILKIFARPSGWGKSVNMNLMKIFCEIHVNEKTQEIVPNHETASYRLFEHGEVVTENGTVRKLRDPLLVSTDRSFMLKHQGQYIVVYMDLGGLKAKNIVDLKKGVAGRARLAFKAYNCEHIAAALGADVRLIDEMARRIRGEKNDWTSFHVICNLLKKYYKRELIVMVEDYDDAVMELIASSVPNKTNTVDEFLEFYESFFKMLENNKFYKRTILTGTTRALFDSDLVTTDIGDELVGESLYLYHGFNEREMGLIFDHLQTPVSLRKRATEYYSGYQFNEKEVNIYNPTSVVKFLASGKIDSYWTPKRCIETIFSKTLLIPVFRYILLAFDVFSLRETKRPYATNLIHKEYLVNHRLDQFLSYLEDPQSKIEKENKTFLMLGYYTDVALEVPQYLLRCHGYLSRTYDVPNIEVDQKIRNKLISFYSSRWQFKGKDNPRNSSLHVLCEKLGEFLLNNETRSDELNKVFLNFLNDLTEFNATVNANNASELRQDMRKIYAIPDVLNLIAAYISGFPVVHSGSLSRGEEGFAEGHVVFRRQNLGICIEMTVGYLSVENTLVITHRLVEYLRPFTEEEKKLGRVKRVAVHYQPDGFLRILAAVDETKVL